ncbi:MAG: hypothetical protein DGJ47_000447, partial [Rickettsiaceae bacterium]
MVQVDNSQDRDQENVDLEYNIIAKFNIKQLSSLIRDIERNKNLAESLKKEQIKRAKNLLEGYKKLNMKEFTHDELIDQVVKMETTKLGPKIDYLKTFKEWTGPSEDRFDKSIGQGLLVTYDKNKLSSKAQKALKEARRDVNRQWSLSNMEKKTVLKSTAAFMKIVMSEQPDLNNVDNLLGGKNIVQCDDYADIKKLMDRSEDVLKNLKNLEQSKIPTIEKLASAAKKLLQCVEKISGKVTGLFATAVESIERKSQQK